MLLINLISTKYSSIIIRILALVLVFINTGLTQYFLSTGSLLTGQVFSFSILDISNIVLACDYHNGWIEDNPKKAHELGLTVHSWEPKPKKKPTE